MRICLACHKVGAGVEKCEQRNRCQIISRGFRFEPASDVLSEKPKEGELSEMPQHDGPIPGDAAPRMPLPAQHDPEYIAAGGALARSEVTSALHAPPLVQPVHPDAAATIAPRAGRPVVTSPDGNPKTAVGLTKPSLNAIPPVALLYLGKAMADGNRKYGLVNWRHDPITASTYYNALMRHALSWWDGEDVDPLTLIEHLAYIMANCAILLDAAAQGTLTDDRPALKGKTAELIRNLTEKQP